MQVLAFGKRHGVTFNMILFFLIIRLVLAEGLAVLCLKASCLEPMFIISGSVTCRNLSFKTVCVIYFRNILLQNLLLT